MMRVSVTKIDKTKQHILYSEFTYSDNTDNSNLGLGSLP